VRWFIVLIELTRHGAAGDSANSAQVMSPLPVCGKIYRPPGWSPTVLRLALWTSAPPPPLVQASPRGAVRLDTEFFLSMFDVRLVLSFFFLYCSIGTAPLEVRITTFFLSKKSPCKLHCSKHNRTINKIKDCSNPRAHYRIAHHRPNLN
jgi:hypothetical protein